MKNKLFNKLLILTIGLLTICSTQAWAQSTTHTSNVTMTAGTNGSAVKVSISDTEYDAMKLGGSKATGTMTFKVPSGTTKFYIHVAGWKGDGTHTLNLSASNGTLGTTSISLTNDDAITGTATTFTLDATTASTTYYSEVSISNVTAESTITLTTSAKRAVVWGINYVAGAADTRTAVNMSTFTTADGVTSIVKGNTLATSVTNDQSGWTAAYTYESSNTSVATVAADGTITAVAKGTANITAKLNISNTDANYKAGTTTSKSIGITVTNPTHHYTFSANDDTFSEGDVEEGEAITFPAEKPSGCNGKVFTGWYGSSYSHATQAPTYVSSATMGENDVTFYAVFAKQTGGAVTWTKTAASAVTAGTYAIITTDGHAFNGTISSGHGQVTSTAFSFTDNVANSAPDGTLEITIAASGSGYTMYNADNGYLYASAASSGKLAWHSTENSYWSYASSNWKYASNSAYLRSYNNNSIRTYSTNNGDVLQFAKKTGGSYSEYVTECCTPLAAPTGMSSTPNGTGGVVTWNAVTNASGYEVKVGDGEWTSTGVDVENRRYTITGKECGGNTVNWQVRATGTGSYCAEGAACAEQNFSTTQCACTNTYSFHFGTKDQSDWNATNYCFVNSEVSDGNTGTYYYIENFELPNKPNYYVGWAGNWNTEYWSSSTDAFSDMPLHHLHSSKALGTYESGQSVGAIGTLCIRGSYNNNNKYIDFIPGGYVLKIGSGYTSYALNPASANILETVWQTDVMTLTEDMINNKAQVLLKTATGSVWNNTMSSDITVKGNMGQKSGADNNWGTNLNTSDVGQTGKFRIWADNGNPNWCLHFVPYYNATFMNNGAEQSHTDLKSVEETNTITFPTPTARPYYDFVGWYDNAEFTGTKFDVGGSYGLNYTTKSKTFYAKWTPTSYTITYNDLNGATNSNPTSYTVESATINLANPGSRDGYRFDGWYKEAAGAGSQVTTIANGSTGNVVVYAKWTQIHTITYVIPTGGGTLAAGAAVSADNGATITMPNIQEAHPAGYDCETLIGWTTASGDYKSETGAKPASFYAVGESSPTISAATTFYAVYSRPGQGESGTIGLTSEEIIDHFKKTTAEGTGAYDTEKSWIDGTDEWVTNGYTTAVDYIQLKAGEAHYLKIPTQAGNLTSITIESNSNSSSRTVYLTSSTSTTPQLASKQIDAKATSTTWDVSGANIAGGYLYVSGYNLQIKSISVSYGSAPIISTTLDCNTAINKFSITYDANTLNFPGSTITCSNVSNYKFSEHDGSYTLCNDASYQDNGATFLGWNSQANGKGTISYSAGQVINSITVDNLTLYAQWAFNVIKNDNGSSSTVHPDAVGGAIVLADGTEVCSPAKYEFVGWTTANPNDWRQNINRPALISNASTTGYTPTAPNTNVYAVYGMSTAVGSNAFYLGYLNGSGDKYYMLAENFNKSAANTTTSARVLYKETINASENKYHLYYMNGGTKTYIYLTAGNTTSLSTTTTKDDNKGWVITSLGAGVSIQNMQYTNRYLTYNSAGNFAAMTDNHTMFFETGAPEYKYFDQTTCSDEITITYNAGGGTMTPFKTTEVAHAGDNIALPTCTYPGWTFQGWVTSSQALSEQTLPTIYTGSYTVPAGNTTLYAYYSQTPTPPAFDASQSGVYKIYYSDGTGTYKYADAQTSGGTTSGEYRLVNTCADAEDWTFTYVAPNRFTIQAENGQYLRGKAVGDNDLMLSNTEMIWTLTQVEGKWRVMSDADNNRVLGFQKGLDFEHLAVSQVSNGAYTLPSIGECVATKYTTNPAAQKSMHLLGNVKVTSSKDVAFAAVNKLTLDLEGMAPNTEVTLEGTDLSFRKANGYSWTSVRTNANGALNEQVIVVYTPSDYALTNVKPTITVTCGSDQQSFSNLVTARSLPEKFVIAQKVDGQWYALPNTMGNSQSNPTGVRIEVDEELGEATIRHSTTDMFAYKMLRGKESDGKMVFSSPVMENKIIKVHTSSATTIGLYAQSGWTSTSGALYEFAPASSDLTDYTLYNASQNKYIGIESGKWGVYTGAPVVRFFAIKQVAPAAITWYNEALSANHLQNTAENGVLTLPATEPTSCSAAVEAGWTFYGWGEQIADYATTAPAIVHAGDVQTTDKTFYAIFKHPTEDRWRTACPTIYKVTYHANGGAGSDYTVYSDLGGTHTVLYPDAAEITNTNAYTFKGWNTSSAATSASVQPGASVTYTVSPIHYYAIWSARTASAVYKSVKTSADPVVTKLGDYYVGDIIPLPYTATSVPGYEFVGWSTAITCDNVAKNALNGTFYRKGDNFTITAAEHTLYAVYARGSNASTAYDGLLLTRSTDLVTGGKYVLRLEQNTTQGTGFGSATSTITNNTIAMDGSTVAAGTSNIAPTSNTVWTLLPGGKANSFKIQSNDGKYLQNNDNNAVALASTSTQVRTDWSFTYSVGDQGWLVKNVDGAKYLIRNQSSDFWGLRVVASYATYRHNIQIYRLFGDWTTCPKEGYTLSWALTGCSVDETESYQTYEDMTTSSTLADLENIVVFDEPKTKEIWLQLNLTSGYSWPAASAVSVTMDGTTPFTNWDYQFIDESTAVILINPTTFTGSVHVTLAACSEMDELEVTEELTVSGSTGSLKLSWEAIAGATDWRITYTKVGGSTTTVEAPAEHKTDTEYTITGLPKDADYDWTVEVMMGSCQTVATGHTRITCYFVYLDDMHHLTAANFAGTEQPIGPDNRYYGTHTFPSLPDQTEGAACSDAHWIFVGWSKSIHDSDHILNSWTEGDSYKSAGAEASPGKRTSPVIWHAVWAKDND